MQQIKTKTQELKLQKDYPMKHNIDPIPKDYHSINPALVIRNAAEAIDFYKKAFRAEVLFRQDMPDGKLMHAALKIGDSVIMLGEECAPHEGHRQECVCSPDELEGTTVNLFLYVEDCDAVFSRALEAGAEQMTPLEDMFWGDRMGMLRDPYGHVWSVATHIEHVSDQQMQQRVKEFMAHQQG
jgi:PhnB protein